MTDVEQFFQACELIKSDLVNFDITRAFGSMGSNIFLKFGEGKKKLSENNKEFIQHDWTIWISRASWRISKEGQYVIGSDDARGIIESTLQQFLGKRFQTFRFLSSYFDIELNFDDGYQITTFFNCTRENQWTILLSDETDIEVNCSDAEKIKDLQKLAEHFSINENYKKLDVPLPEGVIVNIIYDELQQPTFHFENGYSIYFDHCVWRLEKDNNYVVGYVDCYLDDERYKIKKLNELIGKKIRQIDIANSMMDAKFQFDDQYVLKTFTRRSDVTQWEIFSKSVLIFEAKVQMDTELQKEILMQMMMSCLD